MIRNLDPALTIGRERRRSLATAEQRKRRQNTMAAREQQKRTGAKGRKRLKEPETNSSSKEKSAGSASRKMVVNGISEPRCSEYWYAAAVVAVLRPKNDCHIPLLLPLTTLCVGCAEGSIEFSLRRHGESIVWNAINDLKMPL
jgi:hypothetical protein